MVIAVECPKCQASLRIAFSKFESEIGSTDVYNVQALVCVNPECDNYESNLNDPIKIVETIRHKVN